MHYKAPEIPKRTKLGYLKFGTAFLCKENKAYIKLRHDPMLIEMKPTDEAFICLDIEDNSVVVFDDEAEVIPINALQVTTRRYPDHY